MTRLWDCGKSGNNIEELRLPDNVDGAPLAAYDSTGLVFGVSAAMQGGEGYVSLPQKLKNYLYSQSSKFTFHTSLYPLHQTVHQLV